MISTQGYVFLCAKDTCYNNRCYRSVYTKGRFYVKFINISFLFQQFKMSINVHKFCLCEGCKQLMICLYVTTHNFRLMKPMLPNGRQYGSWNALRCHSIVANQHSPTLWAYLHYWHCCVTLVLALGYTTHQKYVEEDANMELCGTNDKEG